MVKLFEFPHVQFEDFDSVLIILFKILIIYFISIHYLANEIMPVCVFSIISFCLLSKYIFFKCTRAN